MKSLDQVNIEDIASDKKYLLVVSMYERYGDDLLLMETYVLKNENRRGAVYLADNWTHVGNTMGVSIKKAPMSMWLVGDNARSRLAKNDMEAAIKKYGPKDENGVGQKMIITESEPKMIFVKPLVKDWKQKIKEYEKGAGDNKSN